MDLGTSSSDDFPDRYPPYEAAPWPGRGPAQARGGRRRATGLPRGDNQLAFLTNIASGPNNATLTLINRLASPQEDPEG